MDRPFPRAPGRNPARRTQANVPGSLAIAARAILGRTYVEHRLGPRPRPLRKVAPAYPLASRILRFDLGNAGRIGNVTRLRDWRRSTRYSFLSARWARGGLYLG